MYNVGFAVIFLALSLQNLVDCGVARNSFNETTIVIKNNAVLNADENLLPKEEIFPTIDTATIKKTPQPLYEENTGDDANKVQVATGLESESSLPSTVDANSTSADVTDLQATEQPKKEAAVSPTVDATPSNIDATEVQATEQPQNEAGIPSIVDATPSNIDATEVQATTKAKEEKRIPPTVVASLVSVTTQSLDEASGPSTAALEEVQTTSNPQGDSPSPSTIAATSSHATKQPLSETTSPVVSSTAQKTHKLQETTVGPTTTKITTTTTTTTTTATTAATTTETTTEAPSGNTQVNNTNCKNRFSVQRCKQLKVYFSLIDACNRLHVMKTYCQQFCGHCGKIKVPVNKKEYVLIPKKKKVAKVCKDFSNTLCPRFASFCEANAKNGRYMRRFCKKTCNQC